MTLKVTNLTHISRSTLFLNLPDGLRGADSLVVTPELESGTSTMSRLGAAKRIYLNPHKSILSDHRYYLHW